MKTYEYLSSSWHVYYTTIKAVYTEAGLEMTERQVKDALYAYITPVKLEDYISSLKIAVKTDSNRVVCSVFSSVESFST